MLMMNNNESQYMQCWFDLYSCFIIINIIWFIDILSKAKTQRSVHK